MADFAHLDHNVDTWPSWGSLAIDSFMIDNWNPSSDKSDKDQRLALVRQYVQIGALGRKQHAQRAANGSVKPTEDQVANILRPLRSPTLRYVTAKWNESPGCIWLRVDYEDEDRHKSFCENLLNLECIDCGEGLYEDSAILSDSRYYNLDSWQEVLDILPEIVSNQQKEQEVTNETYRMSQYRRELERELVEWEGAPEGARTVLARQQSFCCACFFIVEDREMFATDPPRFHALWLDDCGNVVRQNRITAEEACDYPPMAAEGMADEQSIWLEAEVGPQYVSGAPYGPAFSATASGS